MYFRFYKNHYQIDSDQFLSLEQYIQDVTNPIPKYQSWINDVREIKSKLTKELLKQDENEYKRIEVLYKKAKLDLPCIEPAVGFRSNVRGEKQSQLNPVFPIDVEGEGSLEALMTKAVNHILLVNKSVGGTDHVAYVVGPPIFTQDDMKKKYKAYAQLVQIFCDVPTNEGQQSYKKRRAISIDPNLYYNPNAKPLMLEAVKEKKAEAPKRVTHFDLDYEQSKIENKIDYLIKHNLDLTENYYDWVKIGFAFLSAFPESTAKRYFMQVSSMNPNYNERDCAEKFENLKSTYNKDSDGGITLNTFYYLYNNLKRETMKRK